MSTSARSPTDALQVDNEKKTIKITLPPPQQSTAALDMQKSYVVEEERGLLTSIGDAFRSDPDKQQKVYQLAQQRITEAARAQRPRPAGPARTPSACWRACSPASATPR